MPTTRDDGVRLYTTKETEEQCGRAPMAVAELRYDGFSYRAVRCHHGTGTGTWWYRYNRGWQAVAYDALPRRVYEGLLARLKSNGAFRGGNIARVNEALEGKIEIVPRRRLRSGAEITVIASIMDRGFDEDRAKGFVEAIKERDPETWRSLLETMDARHVGSAVLDWAHSNLRRKPNPVIQYTSTETFEGVKKDYAQWPIKWWREVVQNAVDAGATTIKLDVVDNGETVTASCEDDGKGMSREVLTEKFLTFGGTTKPGEEGMAGGFGEAKKLILLPHLSWEVHTRGLRAKGSKLAYEIEEAPHLSGTRVSATMQKGWKTETSAADARAFIAKCFLPHVKFLVNGSASVQAKLAETRAIGELAGKARVAFTPAEGSTSYSMLFRTRGLYMFDLSLSETIEGFVIVELTAPSIDVLTANRDGFRDEDLQREVTRFANRLAVDVKSALKSEKGIFRKKYEGTGKFKAKAQAEKIASWVGPVATGRPEATIKLEIQEQIAERLRDIVEPSPARSPRHEAPQASLIELAPKMRDADDIERVIKQLIWKPDFFVTNEIEKYKPPKEFFPGDMSPRIVKLASVWTELCRLVFVQLGSDAEYGVGFIFSHDTGAQFLRADGEDWILLNPFRDYKRQKNVWRTSTDEDLQWLYALAIHECTHIADNVHRHDEDFSSALTNNIAKCAKGWRHVKQIASSIKMGEGRESGEKREKEPASPEEKKRALIEKAKAAAIRAVSSREIPSFEDGAVMTMPLLAWLRNHYEKTIERRVGLTEDEIYDVSYEIEKFLSNRSLKP